MKKNICMLLFISLLMSAGCSKDKPDASDTESSPVPAAQPSPAADVEKLGHAMRPDSKPPRIVSASGSYRDEERGEQVSYALSFEDSGEDPGEKREDDPVIFRKHPTQWKLTENFSPENRDKNPNNLPYFIITMADEDTPADKMSLAYEISASDQFSNKPRQYIQALRYQDVGKKQWLIVLAEEKVRDREIYRSMGKRAYTLYLKATDGEHEMFKTATFYVENVFPKIEIIEDPRYMDASSYPLIHQFRSIFWAEKHKEYLEILRSGQSFSDLIVFTKIFIENKHSQEVRFKVNFEKLLFEYGFQERYQAWAEDKFIDELIYEKIRRDAEVTYELLGWEGVNEVVKPRKIDKGGNNKYFIIPAANLGGDQNNHSGLIMFFQSQFNLRDTYLEKTNNDTILKANLFIDTIKLNGFVRVSVAPEGMPEAFYQLEANWHEYTKPVKMAVMLISN